MKPVFRITGTYVPSRNEKHGKMYRMSENFDEGKLT